MEPFREGNRKLMEEYFGKDEDLFQMDFSQKQKMDARQHGDGERYHQLYRQCLPYSSDRKNRELRARMQTMEKEWSASRKKAEEKESGKKNPLRKVVCGG